MRSGANWRRLGQVLPQRVVGRLVVVRANLSRPVDIHHDTSARLAACLLSFGGQVDRVWPKWRLNWAQLELLNWRLKWAEIGPVEQRLGEFGRRRVWSARNKIRGQ